jgi:hypothetical protein
LDDYNSDGLVTVSSGSPGHWQPLFDDDMRNFGTWNLHVLNVRTRYLRFTRDMGGNFAEVAVYTNTWVNQFAEPAITSLVLSNNGSVTLSGAGVPGSQIMFWATTNLVSGIWEPLSTNTIDVSGTWQLIDPVAPGVRQKFYKASSP